ncbi:MAG TPA: methyltransferase domain-containing protein [Acidimicrobiia bacterium]|nr:methyltransferase domain-containing protein [Acidimicrobiia bacterium]
MTTRDTWNPDRYGTFRAERARPFDDLLALVDPAPDGRRPERVVDLGCGTGELTARLADHLGAADTVGVDSSPAMLEKARPRERPGLRFELGDIGAFAPPADYDVIFSNAALHWVPDHPALLARLRAGLRPGGQLAVQVPANGDHPSHALAFEVAHEEPFAAALAAAGDDLAEATPVLAPERYATILDDLGFADQHVRLQVYGHHLASTADVVEWTRGTTLTRYERSLPPELYAAFVERYRQRVRAVLGDRSPFFYTFKRLLLRGRLNRS